MRTWQGNSYGSAISKPRVTILFEIIKKKSNEHEIRNISYI